MRPEERRTLAVLRWPELGFLGLVIPILRQTPFIAGRFFIAGDLSRRAFFGLRPCTRTWLSVVRTAGELEKGRDEVDEPICVVPLRPRLARTAVRGDVDVMTVLPVFVRGRVRDRSACSANREGMSCIV